MLVCSVVNTSQERALDITPASFRGYTGATFGNRFTLRGLDINCEPDGLHLKLAWESTVAQELNVTNAIHLTNGAGAILAQSAYKPKKGQSLRKGDVWLVTQLIPANKLNGNMKNVAIVLFEDLQHLLIIDQGVRDWGGKRLFVPVESCSVSNQTASHALTCTDSERPKIMGSSI